MREIRALVIAAILMVCSLAGHAQDLPNVIVIMPDDLGWGDVGYNGSEISTPVIDQLAAEGVVLTRYYTYPTCSPTRSSFYTGKRSLSLGTIVPLPPWTDAGMPPGEKLLPQYLADGGYTTWLVGKWHLGHAYHDQHPQSRGYDHFYGTLGGEINYYTHALNRFPDWERNGEALRERGYATHLLRDEAVELLNSYDGEAPFFLHFSPTAPHAPLQAPEEAVDAYASIEDFNRRRLAAMITELDSAIGGIIDAVQQRDDADNTLILFVSDNGGDLPAGASSGPLRGGKQTPYEGGIRVPAFIWWPSRLSPGGVSEFISVHDWLPTLITLAGIEPANDLAGLDVWPAITGGQIVREQPIVFGAAMPGGPRVMAIHEGWKLIRPMLPGRADTQSPDVELYHVIADPAETTNLAATETARVGHMLDFLSGVPVARPIGADPPPPDHDGPTGPEIEPDDRLPNQPPRAVSMTDRP